MPQRTLLLVSAALTAFVLILVGALAGRATSPAPQAQPALPAVPAQDTPVAAPAPSPEPARPAPAAAETTEPLPAESPAAAPRYEREDDDDDGYVTAGRREGKHHGRKHREHEDGDD